VREIYEEAGLSAGSVYLYFQSKDEIVEALTEEILGHLSRAQGVLEIAEDPLDGVISLVRGLAAAASLAPADALSLRVQGWAAAVTHPAIAGFFRAGFDETRGALVAAVERGKMTGAVESSADPEAVARVAIGMLQGLVLQLALETGVDVGAYAEVCARLLEEALRPRAAG